VARLSLRTEERLGLVHGSDGRAVREAVLQKSGTPPPLFTVPPACDEWFIALAEELPDRGTLSAAGFEDIADSLAGKVHAWMAPIILAVIAPHVLVPSCPATQLLAQCKAEVKRLLPTFLARVASRLADEEDSS
jgi:hypothetical protein